MIGPASAGVIIDFGTGTVGSGGSLVISGSTVTGTNIPLGVMNFTDPLGNVTVYATSGTATSSSGTLAAALNFNWNGTTGNITVTGGVPALGVPNGTTLLTGTFSTFNINSTGFLGAVSGSGLDTKSPLLLAALGVPVNTPFTFFGFSIGGPKSGVANTYTPTSTDVANSSVPEPGAMLLLGTVLVGITYGLRRRSSKV
jgi:hypothetical protein